MQSFLSRFAFCRRYSTQFSPEVISKWRLRGVPAPKSILDDDDTPVDLSEDVKAEDKDVAKKPDPHERGSTPFTAMRHRQKMKKSFPTGWNPPRKISREAMEGLRELHRIDKERFSTPVLAEKFRISPEAVRRILKSKWSPSAEQQTKQALQERKDYEQFRSLNRLRERLEAERLRSASPRKRSDQEDSLFFR